VVGERAESHAVAANALIKGHHSSHQTDVSTPTGCRAGADPFTIDTTRRYRVLLNIQ
jgi:hypothetical protein